MKSILIITYYWPPSGGSAVQRWLSFSNHLSELGHQVHVLTVDEKDATYPLVDKSLTQKINSNVSVHTSPTKELFWIYQKYIGKGKVPSAGFANEGKPSIIQLLARFVRGNFFIPDARKSWNKTAIPTAIDIVEKHNIDCIITAGPPHSSHLIGEAVKRKFPSLQWSVDFHDAWTDVWYYDKLLKTKLAISYDKQLEKRILEKSDSILTVGTFLADKLCKKSTLDLAKKMTIISMGYDDEIAVFEPKNNELFQIVYTGTIGAQYEPNIVLQAVANLIKVNPKLPIQLKFVGLLDPIIQDEIKKIGIDSYVEYVGYVSHEKSIEYIQHAQMLLLVSPKVSSERIIIPGKIYEYLAVRKPILNLGDKLSNTASIISACDSGINVDRHELKIIEDFITREINNWKLKTPSTLTFNTEKINSYKRSQEAKKISVLIESFKSTH